MKSVLQFKNNISPSEWMDFGIIRPVGSKYFKAVPIMSKDWEGKPITTSYRITVKAETFEMPYQFRIILDGFYSSLETNLIFRVRSDEYIIDSIKRTDDLDAGTEIVRFPSAHGFSTDDIVMLRDAIDRIPVYLSGAGTYFVYVISTTQIYLRGYSGGANINIGEPVLEIIDVIKPVSLDYIPLGEQQFSWSYDQQRDRNTYPKYTLELDFIVDIDKFYDLQNWLTL